ncbi:universal stress protein [uncultured Jannaschia sp.]|uniref:universal stress protein n=1 Tax=uncultured Jannaschia sp. TaxID=293347 RepID=UPI00260424AE|nr:universal stress protein [uncultured Jannaschia sp.]
MALKSILAAYVGDAAGSGGLMLASHMARKYDAHLTGVVWHGPSPLEHRFHRYITKEVRDAISSREDEIVAGIRADFQSRISDEGLDGRAHFIDLRSDSDFSLASCARKYDITVIGHRASALGRNQFSVRPDVVALRSGKPVVVVPPAFDPAKLGTRALVAWDGKRSAARALGDALHILATKEQVTVLTIGEPPADELGDGPVDLLARHGISAERLIRPEASGGVAATILAACAETRAGLLIMGAYEHSKFAEDLLGGVTRNILNAAELPILMSH